MLRERLARARVVERAVAERERVRTRGREGER